MPECLEVDATASRAAGNCSRASQPRNDEGAGAGETRKPAVDEGKASKGNRA
jgi:hypothetical protein